MKIQQYRIFKFNAQLSIYESLGNSHYQNPISHVEFFLEECYGYVHRYGGPIKFVSQLGQSGMGFNDLDISIDTKNNLIYISHLFFAPNYYDIMTEEEFYLKTDRMSNLELYQQNLLTSAVITEDNFIDLLTTWSKMLHIMPPFLLLYQADQNWYGIVPFDSQKAMEEFIADHTK